MSYIMGIDLGQAADPTAIAVVERKVRAEDGKSLYHLRYLQRLALGTLYPAITAHVAGLLGKPPLLGNTDLAIDRTGVGAPVYDAFVEAGLRPTGITITGGAAVGHDEHGFTVPKRDLIGQLVVLLHDKRLLIAEGLAEAATLVHELTNFRYSISAAGNDSYAPWRENMHDDTILATAIATWYAERIGGIGRLADVVQPMQVSRFAGTLTARRRW